MTRRYVPALLLTLALSAVAAQARAESQPEWVLAILATRPSSPAASPAQ